VATGSHIEKSVSENSDLGLDRAASDQTAQTWPLRSGRGPNSAEPFAASGLRGSHRFRPVTGSCPSRARGSPGVPARAAAVANSGQGGSAASAHRRNRHQSPSRSGSRAAEFRPEPVRVRPPAKPVLAGVQAATSPAETAGAEALLAGDAAAGRSAGRPPVDGMDRGPEMTQQPPGLVGLKADR